MDAFISTMCALHDFKIKIIHGLVQYTLVKPKMHGLKKLHSQINYLK